MELNHDVWCYHVAGLDDLSLLALSPGIARARVSIANALGVAKALCGLMVDPRRSRGSNMSQHDAEDTPWALSGLMSEGC